MFGISPPQILANISFRVAASDSNSNEVFGYIIDQLLCKEENWGLMIRVM